MSQHIVTVIAALRVKPGAEDRARQLLHRVIAPTLEEPGCLAYDLHQSVTDPTEFMFYERWVERCGACGARRLHRSAPARAARATR